MNTFASVHRLPGPRRKKSVRVLAYLFVFILLCTFALPSVSEAMGNFLIVSSDKMNWNDARAFCRQHGGRLPRVNQSDSWDGSGGSVATAEGFGTIGGPWPSGLPQAVWSDTRDSTEPGKVWVIYDSNSIHGFGIGPDPDDELAWAACIR